MCSKGAGFIYAWMKSHKKHTKRIDNKRILIIFGGRLGNAVLNVDALLELKKIYPEAEGYRICVICSRNLKKDVYKRQSHNRKYQDPSDSYD